MIKTIRMERKEAKEKMRDKKDVSRGREKWRKEKDDKVEDIRI